MDKKKYSKLEGNLRDVVVVVDHHQHQQLNLPTSVEADQMEQSNHQQRIMVHQAQRVHLDRMMKSWRKHRKIN